MQRKRGELISDFNKLDMVLTESKKQKFFVIHVCSVSNFLPLENWFA